MGYDEIQVILSDDCSTESYQDIVNQYIDKLFITQTKTDYNCCPGNTRQKGADQALGEWLIFMDHDD
jgi:glycosyltransferase involved in cell wall biosynthesis